MNLVQSTINSGTATPVSTQTAILNSPVTLGNLVVLTGVFSDSSTGPVVITVNVTDSIGNTYSIGSAPFRTGLNQDFWMQYCIVDSNATGVVISVNYSTGVANASFSVSEFSAPFDWIASLDGFRAANTGLSSPSTPINTGPFTTTNADDLILALVNFSQPTLTLLPGWQMGPTLHLGYATAWIEQPSPGSIGFTATQGGGVADLWSAAVWAFKAAPNPGGGEQTFDLITSSINITYFQESYQNRVPEDIYDSLEGQPGFVYVQYGPSILNV